MRLDGDLRAVAGLAGDAADLDEAVGDLRHLELEERLDQLGIAPRQDHLRALRPRTDLGDDRLDAAALLVTLAVHLFGAREERLDLAKIDKDVVAVAGLLDDSRHDLGHAVDVLVVHHLALGLANALQDDLLRSLRGDAAEVLGRDVGALDLVLGNFRPVDDEVVVRDQRVGALAVFGLGGFELGNRPLARLVHEPLLDVRRKLDRPHAEVAARIELDGRVAGCARGFLVRGEQRILERADEDVVLDPLLALDLPDRLENLSTHRYRLSSIRFPRTIAL